MIVKPKPQELQILFGDIDSEGHISVATEALVTEHREVNCPSYDDCLQIAYDSKWKNFTCTACPMRSSHVKSPGASVYDRQRMVP